MESFLLIGSVLLIHFFALLSPGPDFIMAIKNSLRYSRNTGIFTAVGFGLGIAVHILYSIAGIALIISQSIILFNIIKILGALYLIYIGYKSITSKSSHADLSTESAKEDISPITAIRIGFLTNVLNPKATLFFLSLFTLVISPDTPTLTLVTMSLLMVMNTTIWFSLVAVFFTQKTVQNQYKKFESIFNKIFGTALVALGIKVALTQK